MSTLRRAFTKNILCLVLASSTAFAIEDGEKIKPVGRVAPFSRSVSCAPQAEGAQMLPATRASSAPGVRPTHSLYWEARLALDHESQEELRKFTKGGAASFFQPLFLMEFPQVEQSSASKHTDINGNVIGQSASFETYLKTTLQDPVENRFLGDDGRERCVNSQSFTLQAVEQDAKDPLILWGVLDDPDGILKDFHTFAQVQANNILPQLKLLKSELQILKQPQKDSACRIKIGNIAQGSRGLDGYHKEARALAGILTENLRTSPLEVKFQFFPHSSKSEPISLDGAYAIQTGWRSELKK